MPDSRESVKSLDLNLDLICERCGIRFAWTKPSERSTPDEPVYLLQQHGGDKPGPLSHSRRRFRITGAGGPGNGKLHFNCDGDLGCGRRDIQVSQRTLEAAMRSGDGYLVR